MKDNEQPPPLDQMADTPPELLQVMRALGREAPSRAVLERVAGQLGPLLDAAPGIAVPSAVKTGGSLGKFVIARAVAALLAVGGTVYWLQGAREAPPAPAPSAPESREVARVVTPEVPVAVPASPAPVMAVAEPVRVTRPRTHRARTKRAFVEVRREPVAALAAPESETPAAAAAPVATVEEAKPVEHEATPPAPPQPDEFTLLWQAREHMRKDPAGSLALLQTHTERFGNGQLAPEREVLAVEALRALGRKDEAELRLQAFRKRYPGSIHLRRLQQAP